MKRIGKRKAIISILVLSLVMAMGCISYLSKDIYAVGSGSQTLYLVGSGTFDAGEVPNYDYALTNADGVSIDSQTGWYTEYELINEVTTPLVDGQKYYKKVVIKDDDNDPIIFLPLEVTPGVIKFNQQDSVDDYKYNVIIERNPGVRLDFSFDEPETYEELEALAGQSVTSNGNSSSGVFSDTINPIEGQKYMAAILSFIDDADSTKIKSISSVKINGVDYYNNILPQNPEDDLTFLETYKVGWSAPETEDAPAIIILYYDFTKTIDNASLVATGVLLEGIDPADQTLIFKEPDGANYTSDDEIGYYWYTDPSCDDAYEADTITNGIKYYKKIYIDASEGYVFDESIDTVTITGGNYTVESAGVNGDGQIEVVMGVVATDHVDPEPAPSHKKKKKKVEEPKVEEPKIEEPKIEEPKMNGDVKLAKSNEGKNINPNVKYILGYGDGTFKPDQKVNNIEIMSMVTELFDNVTIKENKYLGQESDFWGNSIINKANALGFIPGNKDSLTYNVRGDITRGDFAVVVYNVIKDYTDSPSLSETKNCMDAIGSGYEKAVTKLVDLGVFKGYSDGSFKGNNTLTRAEAVVVINRALRSLGIKINMPVITTTFDDLNNSHWAYDEIMFASNK